MAALMMLTMFVVGGLTCAAAQSGPCTVHIQDLNTITEQDPPGTEILNISATSSVQWTMTIDYQAGLTGIQGQLDPYLTLERENSTDNYVLKVTKTLDLEEIFDDLGVAVSTLSLRLSCTESGLPPVTTTIFLNVQPVNEFQPEFDSDNFNVNISEHADVGSTLITLTQHARDRDVNPALSEIRGFSILPVSYHSVGGKPGDDGRGYFTMTDRQQGRIELSRGLDFETLYVQNQTIMWLNVTVMDTSGYSSWATIQVTVLDYDDLSPEFFFKGCPDYTGPCLVTYTIRVLANSTGPVDDVMPAPVYARDRDTIDNPVTYQLRDSSVRGDSLASHLEINQTTGELTVVQPFMDLDYYEDIVFVVAEEVSLNRFTAQATLQIDVYSPTFDPGLTKLTSSPADNTRKASTGSVDPGSSGGGDSGGDSDSTEQVAVIGMCVLGVLVMALLVVAFVLALTIRKLKIAKVAPQEDDQSPITPAQGEDTLSQDTQSTTGEETPRPRPMTTDQAELLSSLPDPANRAGKLPPLDGATVSNGGPHADVFDGTRTFEMGLKQEFFTTPGKKKIPLERDGHGDGGEPIMIKGEA